MKVLKIFPKQFRLYCLGLLSAACFAGTVYISPSEDPYTEIQEALILASPGDIIHLSAGLYELEDSLSIDVNNLVLEGEGIDETVLSSSWLNSEFETVSSHQLPNFHLAYLEDTINMLANKGGIDLVKLVSKQGELKQTENGYRYIMVDENKKNDICPMHSTLLNEDGSCNKCLNENNK